MPRPRLKKRWGQHHLVHGSALRPLLDFLKPAGRWVAEIGPGAGILTRELLRLGASVTAWEIDLSWACELHERRLAGAFRLVAGDALSVDWSRLPAGALVAGNLPYNIATPLLDLLLSSGERISRIGVLIQREVAQRLIAAPGDRAYGALSVLTQARARAEYLGTVEASEFRPRPRVESAFVGLTPHSPRFPVSGEWSQFRATVLQAFSHRRKTLSNSLAASWGRERASLLVGEAGFSPRARAEELGIEDFALLARLERQAWKR